MNAKYKKGKKISTNYENQIIYEHYINYIMKKYSS